MSRSSQQKYESLYTQEKTRALISDRVKKISNKNNQWNYSLGAFAFCKECFFGMSVFQTYLSTIKVTISHPKMEFIFYHSLYVYTVHVLVYIYIYIYIYTGLTSKVQRNIQTPFICIPNSIH